MLTCKLHEIILTLQNLLKMTQYAKKKNDPAILLV